MTFLTMLVMWELLLFGLYEGGGRFFYYSIDEYYKLPIDQRSPLLDWSIDKLTTVGGFTC